MSLRSFIDRLNGGSEKAEEDRKILLWKKWGVARQSHYNKSGSRNIADEIRRATKYKNRDQFNFPCPDTICNRTFSTEGRLEKHIQKNHPGHSGKWHVKPVDQLYVNLTSQMSQQEKSTFYTDLNQGKILAKKRAKEDALAEKIIQVEPRLWPAKVIDVSTNDWKMDILLLRNLIGDIDEKLVARMNDANAEREEMKASINSIQERMKISERILQKVINFITSSNS